MKTYILIENAEPGNPAIISVFPSCDARAKATRATILGPPSPQTERLNCPELSQLATHGSVDFEGDPSLEWIDTDQSIDDVLAVFRNYLS